MPTAILIAFEYSFNPLPGAGVDLYQAVRWCQSFNCQIHLLTDIRSGPDTTTLKQVIHQQIADSNILTFYNHLNQSKSFPDVSSQHHIATAEDLVFSLSSIDLSSDAKLIIYYSGHGVQDAMVLPNKSRFDFLDFRDTILRKLDSYVEIFWILDCCNPHGLHLPYTLENNRFRLSSSRIQCVTQPILLITSSEANEKSIATRHGSLFSRYLFQLLTTLNSKVQMTTSIPTSKNRNLRRLIGHLRSSIRRMHTGYNQTVSIYSSYVIDPVLWMWIGSSKSYDIVADLSLAMLILRSTDGPIQKDT